MFQAVNILSGHGGGNGGRCGPQIQECWEFEHPRRDVVLNDRGKSLLPPSDMSQCALSGADCFDATCLRVTAHEQPQHSVRDADVPHPSRWDTPWARWLLRGGVIWGGRAQHTSDPEGTCFQGHAELVPAVLPPKGKAHPHTHIACRSVLPPPLRASFVVSMFAVFLLLTGTPVLAEQLRAAGFRLAPDGSTPGVVRVVC